MVIKIFLKLIFLFTLNCHSPPSKQGHVASVFIPGSRQTDNIILETDNIILETDNIILETDNIILETDNIILKTEI